MAKQRSQIISVFTAGRELRMQGGGDRVRGLNNNGGGGVWKGRTFKGWKGAVGDKKM